MHLRLDLPRAGSFVSWGGVIVVVLAVVGGLLGMHVIGGAQAAPMAPTAMSSTVMTPSSATPEMGSDHRAPSDTTPLHGSPAGDLVVGLAAPDHQESPVVCACAAAGCGASMAMHGACVPTFGPAVLNIPLPGILTRIQAGKAFPAVTGPTSGDRVPYPPSLTQLSISRT